MIVNTYCALFPPIPLCIRLGEGLQRYTIFKNFSSLIGVFLGIFHGFAVIRSGATSLLPTLRERFRSCLIVPSPHDFFSWSFSSPKHPFTKQLNANFLRGAIFDLYWFDERPI